MKTAEQMILDSDMSGGSNEFLDKLANIMNEYAEQQKPKWVSVKDAPLFEKTGETSWLTTEAGDGEFIALVPYEDSRRPNEKLTWIRHCVVENGGLCVVGDDYNEFAGWDISDVTYYIPMSTLPTPPTE